MPLRVAINRGGGWSRDRSIAYGVLLLGVSVVVLAYWPGSMTIDTLITVAFVRMGVIGDQLSPVLAWAWRQAYRVTGAGPGVVLVVQTTALTAGLYLVLRAAFGRIGAAVAAVLALLAPPAFGLVGLVGRDAWFVSSCLLTTGLGVGILRWGPRARWWAVAGALVAATVAVAARQNGFTAVGPIMIALGAAAFAVTITRWQHWGPWRRRLSAAAVGVTATLTMAATMAVSGSLVRDRAWHPEAYTYLYDLAHLTVEEDRRLIRGLSRDIAPFQTPAEVREHWEGLTGVTMRWDPALEVDVRRWLEEPRQSRVWVQWRDPARPSEATWSVPLYYSDSQAARLAAAWREAVAGDPLTYLTGRLKLWKGLVGIDHRPVGALVGETPENPFGLQSRPSFPVLSSLAVQWTDAWAEPETWWTGSAWHRVWPYLLVCLLGLGFLLPRFPGTVRLVGALMAAVMGLQVGLFFMAPSVELRFQLLTLYAAMIAAAIAARMAWTPLARRWLGRRSTSGR